MEMVTAGSGKIVDQDEYDGTCSMYHVVNIERFLMSIMPELCRRAVESGTQLPIELGLTIGDARWLLHVEAKGGAVEPDKLSRRHLTLTPAAFVRLAMGHTGIDRAIEEDGVESSTGTAVDAARILFPVQPIWRSPLDSGTA